jgi:drug/metabolite transporter (DMT)-like permease
MTTGAPSQRRTLAFAVMVATPAFFSTNLIFGRHLVGEVAPFTLAFLRWSAVAVLLLPFLRGTGKAVLAIAAVRWRLLLLLGFLGMFICGGAVYWALAHTSATNGTLIYSASPVAILFADRLLNGRKIGARETAGSLVAFLGVAAILLKGDPSRIAAAGFNIGDLVFVAAAIAWAFYSVLLRAPAFAGLGNAGLFALVAAAGAATLAPAALAEYLTGAAMPATATAWRDLAGIVVFSSLIAFSGFQFGVRTLGPSLAGVFMYLLPPWGVALAVAVLGETLQGYHMLGIALVVSGVVLATLPAGLLKRR